MKKGLFLAAVASSALSFSAPAHAITVTVSQDLPANDGQFDGYVSNCFNCDIAPLSSLGVWSPVEAGIFDHSVLNYSAQPRNGGTYYSVYNGLTLNLNAATSNNDDGVSFVWGSPSADNVFAVGDFVINGQTILDLLPANDPYGAFVTITGLPSFSEMTWNEAVIDPVTHQPGPGFSLEFNDVSILHSDIPPAIPEPSTWAMMLLGFGSLMLWRQNWLSPIRKRSSI